MADFAVLVLTPDVASTARGETTYTPTDNVIFELGLFLGALGVDRTIFIPTEKAVTLPSDIAGATWANVHARQIESQIRRIGPRKGNFVLCVPAGEGDDEEFSRELKVGLLLRFCHEGIHLIDECPRASEKADEMLANFAAKVRQIAELKPPPRFLLLLWPLIDEHQDRHYVLRILDRLADQGCRVCFLNEFPEIDPSRYEHLWRNKVFIRRNTANATDHVCDFIQRKLAIKSDILLVSAYQKFNSARELKELYERKLSWLEGPLDQVDIDSYKEKDAREAVLERMQAKMHSSKGNGHYNLVIAANDEMGLGAEGAIEEFQRRKSIVHSDTWVIGFDGLASVKRKIKTCLGRFVATVDVTPRTYAEACIDALLDFQQHDEPIEIPVLRDCLVSRIPPPKSSGRDARKRT